ncbi:MAG: hypothetical protein IJ494_05400 [Bacteroides sp.]|nr:hypothetical protein [Bacteroides sp.]
MIQMNRIMTALCYLFPLATAMAQTPRTLTECIEIGIERNLSLNSASIEMDKGKNQLSQSRAKLWPVLGGMLQFTDYLKKPTNVTTGTLLGSDFPDNPTWQTIKHTI